MYKPKMRAGCNDALPPMKKKLATCFMNCICKRRIKIGEVIYFDGWTNKHLCLSCGTLSSASNVVISSEPDEWQLGYDRMRALENLAAPLKKELHEELEQLQQLYRTGGCL